MSSPSVRLSRARRLAFTRRGAAIAVAALAVSPAAAHAAQSWNQFVSAPQVSSNAIQIDSPSLGVAPDGTATFTWLYGQQNTSKTWQLGLHGTAKPGAPISGAIDKVVTAADGHVVLTGHTIRPPYTLFTAVQRGKGWKLRTEQADRNLFTLGARAVGSTDVIVGFEQYSTKSGLAKLWLKRINATTGEATDTGSLSSVGVHGLGEYWSGLALDDAGNALMPVEQLNPGAPANGLNEDNTTPALAAFGGTTSSLMPLDPKLAEARVVQDGTRAAVVGIHPNQWGDSGARGIPAITVKGATGLSATTEIPGSGPRRGIHVRAAAVSGGPFIVTWLEKPGPIGFATFGTPHWASVDPATGKVLKQGTLSKSTRGEGLDVVAVGGKVAAIWSEGTPTSNKAVWRAALLDGTSAKSITAPAGNSIGKYEYSPEFQLAANGNHLAVAAADGVGGQVRVSVTTIK